MQWLPNFSSRLPSFLVSAFSSWSFLLLLFFLYFFPGCSKQTAKDPADLFHQGVVNAEYLRQRYGLINTSHTRSYFQELTRRLLFHIPSQEKPRVHVEVLATDSILAFSAGAGRILVSRGLILSLHSEAELAFVLSHEIAHAMLGHENFVQEEYGLIESSLTKKFEFEADRAALIMLAQSGYDLRASLTTVLHAYQAAHIKEHNNTHPALESRVAFLKAEIARLQWQPPGSLQRRAFVQFQNYLQSFQSLS